MAVAKDLSDELQVVVFTAGGEEYGLEIDQVQEIVRPLPVTRVPGTPEYIEGVVNLRGNVVPVINLHKRLALDRITNSDKSRIIIVSRQDLTAGLIVDSVKDVLNIPAENVELPVLTSKTDVSHLSGIGKHSGCVIPLLDLDNILGGDTE